MVMSLGTLLARDLLLHIQQFGVRQVFFVHFSSFTVMNNTTINAIVTKGSSAPGFNSMHEICIKSEGF